MKAIRSLGVFCGSKNGEDPGFRDAAVRLGQMLVARGVRLIYGGGSIGLMGAIADAVMEGGGQAVGVIPEFLVKYEVAHRGLTELIVVDSMHARKQRIIELADAFAVLPGGLGTLDEFYEVLTGKQLRIHSKPVVVVDTLGHWGPLLAALDRVVESGFAHPAITELYTVVEDVELVFDALVAAPEPREEVFTSHL